MTIQPGIDKTPTPPPSVIVTVLLAVAVLAWGSAYKCSLCHRHPERHARIAAARLLSERERPTVMQSGGAVRVARPRPASFPDHVLPLVLSGAPGTDAGHLPVHPRTRPAAGGKRSLIRTSFRAPPASGA